MNQEQAYKPIYDSTPMNDFLYEVNRCISPKLNNNIRDNERIVSIKSRIEEYKKSPTTNLVSNFKSYHAKKRNKTRRKSGSEGLAQK